MTNYQIYRNHSALQSFSHIRNALKLPHILGGNNGDIWDIISEVTGEILVTCETHDDDVEITYLSPDITRNPQTQELRDNRRLCEILVGIL